jgi:hypothetical protein
MAFERRQIESPACVDLSKTEPKKKFIVDPAFWEECQDHTPFSRFVLSHELGHIFLHEHYRPAYSGIRSKVWFEGDSVEWQADTFADYFLISDTEIATYITPNQISIYCAVERRVVLRRLGKKFSYDGEACRACGNFTMVRNGTCLKCDTCGATWYNT